MNQLVVQLQKVVSDSTRKGAESLTDVPANPLGEQFVPPSIGSGLLQLWLLTLVPPQLPLGQLGSML